MNDFTMVLLSLALIVLTWTVVKINMRISETQRLLKELGEAKGITTGNKAAV